MAVKEVTMYYIVCDNCGYMNDCDSDGHAYIYYSKREAKERAEYEDMMIIDGKQYCKDCWEYDINDNIIIKNKK